MTREEISHRWLREEINYHITTYNKSKTEYAAAYLHGYIAAARMADAVTPDEYAPIFDALLYVRNCPLLTEREG